MPPRPLFHPRSLDLRRGYTRATARADVSAGLSVSLITLPLALALGVASLPAEIAPPFPAAAIGLFSCIIGGFVVALLGGSRVQIAGPTATFIPIILLVVQQHGYTGLILATLMAGVIQILMGLARLGNLIKFIPYPVTSGLTTGIALLIIVNQLPDLLGLPPGAPLAAPERLGWIAQNLPHLNPAAALLGGLVIALILIATHRGWKRLPPQFVALVVGSAIAVGLAALDWGNLANIGTRYGQEALPGMFPPFAWPDISFDLIRALIGPATAIALLGSIEALLSAVVADGMIEDRHDANTELIAQGTANLLCPLFGGLPVTGGIARTTANVREGGRTPVAGLTHAAVLLLIVLLFSGLARHVPFAVIAAILITGALRLGEWHELRRLSAMPRGDALVLLTACGLTLLFDLVIAVEVGMVLAAILFIQRVAATTEVSRVTATDELESPEQVAHGKNIPEGVLVYRIFGPFFFGAAEKMEDALTRIGPLPRVLILRLQLVPAIDATALNALESLTERIQRRGGTVILSGLHHQPLDVLRRAGFINQVGRANVVPHFDAALARARTLLAAPEIG